MVSGLTNKQRNYSSSVLLGCRCRLRLPKKSKNYRHLSEDEKYCKGCHPGEQVPLGILGGGVPPGSSNPDPISDQKM